jgi:lipoprotein-releasing system permease protein
MPFELEIALRYLLARRKQARIGIISSLSALGVAVGVMAVIIALGLMTGLQQEVRDRLLDGQPHIFVMRAGGIDDYRAEAARLRQIPEVIGAAPAMMGRALLTSAGGEAPVTLKGIDPDLETSVINLPKALKSGSLDGLTAGSEDQNGGILLGSMLAESLRVRVGDAVSVVTPTGTLSPMGLIPRTKTLHVAGIFSLGLYEFDAQWGFVTLDVARRLVEKDHVDYIQLRIKDMYRAPTVAASVERIAGAEYSTEHWQRMNSSLFSALWLERVAISLAIGLIVFVAALNIVASLILIVMEKHRDIAILKTMGASAKSMTIVFILQGLIIGVVGTAFGATVGWIAAYFADRYKIIQVPMDVYQVSHMPFVVRPLDVLLVIAATVGICFVATIYPSRQAARLDPAQALRYD